MVEKSYVMVKPQFANNMCVIGNIKDRLLAKGLKIEKEGYVYYDTEHARQHYIEHVNKGFYRDLEAYITSDKAYGMVVSGENAIATIRALAGATRDPAEGTIRYDIPKALHLPLRVQENVVHSSDSVEAANREIAIFEDMLAIKDAEVRL